MSSAHSISWVPSGVSRVTLYAMTVMPRGLAATADLARRDTRPAVKAEAFTVMAFMVTADIVVFGVVVGVCDGRRSGVAGALPIGKKPPIARTDKPCHAYTWAGR